LPFSKWVRNLAKGFLSPAMSRLSLAEAFP
jgi:hypothetical protein